MHTRHTRARSHADPSAQPRTRSSHTSHLLRCLHGGQTNTAVLWNLPCLFPLPSGFTTLQSHQRRILIHNSRNFIDLRNGTHRLLTFTPKPLKSPLDVPSRKPSRFPTHYTHSCLEASVCVQPRYLNFKSPTTTGVRSLTDQSLHKSEGPHTRTLL